MSQRETALVLEEESPKPLTQALTHHEKDVKCVTAFLPGSILFEFVVEHREGGTTFFSWVFPLQMVWKAKCLYV